MTFEIYLKMVHGAALGMGADTGLWLRPCAVWAYSPGRRQRPYL